jgi:hypothetical protein
MRVVVGVGVSSQAELLMVVEENWSWVHYRIKVEIAMSWVEGLVVWQEEDLKEREERVEVAGVELKGFLGLVDWHWAVKMGK